MSGINTADCSGNSQITPEFVISLETQLKIQNSISEDFIKQYETSNSSKSQDIHRKYSKLKSMKQEVSNSKSRIEELKKTSQDLKRFSKELSEHLLMLKANIESYDRESISLAVEHKKSLEKADTKWEIYKENYEQRPLAVQLRKKEIGLERSKIELMIKRYKLSEMIKMIAVREAIHKKRRNSLAIESAEIWKEARSTEKGTREAVETEKKLRAEIRRQEAMMKELTEEKRKERLKALEKSSSSIGIEGKRKADNLTTLQFQRLKIPRKSLPQPMPNWWNNNSDNISICSTMIDELIEPTAELQIIETIDPLSQQIEEASQIAGAGNSLEKLSKDLGMKKLNLIGKEKLSSGETSESVAIRLDATGETTNLEDVSDFVAITVDDEIKELETEGNEKRGDLSVEKERHESEKINVEKKRENETITGETLIVRSQESAINYPGYDDRTLNRGSKSNYDVTVLQEGDPPVPPKREIQPRSELRRPIVRSIEAAEFNLPLRRPIAVLRPAETAEPAEEDLLSRFLHRDADLGSEFSWKRSNRGDSLYTVGDDRRRDAELDSILGSQISLRSEEIMKRFRLAFDGSSELQGMNKDGDVDSSMQIIENDKNHRPSQTTNIDDFTSNRSAPTASPFVGIGNIGSTPSTNRDREDRFFINMF